jgi:hypothetical protein
LTKLERLFEHVGVSPTFVPRRPTPPGGAGSWRDARRAPAGEAEQAVEREHEAWSPLVIRVGGAWLLGIVTACRPFPAGRWAHTSLCPAELRAALPEGEEAR